MSANKFLAFLEYPDLTPIYVPLSDDKEELAFYMQIEVGIQLIKNVTDPLLPLEFICYRDEWTDGSSYNETGIGKVYLDVKSGDNFLCHFYLWRDQQYKMRHDVGHIFSSHRISDIFQKIGESILYHIIWKTSPNINELECQDIFWEILENMAIEGDGETVEQVADKVIVLRRGSKVYEYIVDLDTVVFHDKQKELSQKKYHNKQVAYVSLLSRWIMDGSPVVVNDYPWS